MVKIYKIKRFGTKNKGKKNGSMLPIWKDYDSIPKMKPRFVYYFTCAPKTEKGPYLHKKRRGLLTLLEGKAIFIYKIGEKLKAPLSSRRNVGISAKALKEIKLDASREAVMIDVPKGIGYLIKNPYLKEAKFINICDYPWRAGDNETITPDFEGY